MSMKKPLIITSRALFIIYGQNTSLITPNSSLKTNHYYDTTPLNVVAAVPICLRVFI